MNWLELINYLLILQQFWLLHQRKGNKTENTLIYSDIDENIVSSNEKDLQDTEFLNEQLRNNSGDGEVIFGIYKLVKEVKIISKPVLEVL
jgi:hypothetical protein